MFLMFDNCRNLRKMPRFGYSVLILDPSKTAKASGRELNISHKHAREICRTIKGMLVDDAIEYLQKVTKLKRSVPFRRFHKKVGHRSDLREFKWHTGRYPVKAAKKIIELLNLAKSNAEYEELQVDKLLIIHASAYPGRKIKRIFYRAFGRSSPRNNTLTHVELAVEEIS